MATSKKQGMRKRGKLARITKEEAKKTIKGMANPLRNQLVAILHERVASRAELAAELGFNWAEINYEIEALEAAGIVEIVAEKRRGNTIEMFYKATTRAYLDPSEWLDVADPIKASLRSSLFRNLMVDATAAISEETFDSLPGAHMSWTPMILDDEGWKAIVGVLFHALEEAIKVQEESAERLIAADEVGTSCTVSILGYPAAIEKRKVGPPTDARQLVKLVAEEREKEILSRSEKSR